MRTFYVLPVFDMIRIELVHSLVFEYQLRVHLGRGQEFHLVLMMIHLMVPLYFQIWFPTMDHLNPIRDRGLIRARRLIRVAF